MQSLFTDFSNVTKEQWKQKAEQDLKGRPLDTLNWKLDEGFTLEAYYAAGEKELSAPVAAHGAGKITGGEPRQWDNLQVIQVKEEEKANKQALEALNGGATGILFDLSVSRDEVPNLKILLAEIELPYCTIAFKGCLQAPGLFDAFTSYAKNRGFSPEQLNGFILCDLVGQVIKSGIIDHGGYSKWKQTFKRSLEYPNFSTLVLDIAPFHNAGANAVQELALALSLAATYADDLTEEGNSAEEVYSKLSVYTAVGNRYFVEMAKLQSLRYLLAMQASAYGLANFNPATFNIHTTSSRREVSVLDQNTNLLRHTTQTMSAVLGGCNSVAIEPFSKEVSGSLGRRMARNISTILQEEAYFGKVVNPVDGTYYLQQLQQELVEKAWNKFINWEEAGGFRQLAENGKLVEEIVSQRVETENRINTRKEKIVGATAYANLQDEVKAKLSQEGKSKRSLSTRRKAAAFEYARQSARMWEEKNNQNLKALLLQFGDPTMYRARAAFAADFLRAGGWQTAESKPTEEPEEFSLEGFQLVVLCAADEDYNEQAAALIEDLRENGYEGPIYLAGTKSTLDEQVAEAEPDGFINLKSDAPAVYEELLNRVK